VGERRKKQCCGENLPANNTAHCLDDDGGVTTSREAIVDKPQHRDCDTESKSRFHGKVVLGN
jgi:hypothetical protein